MCAERRIGDDAVERPRPRFLIHFARVESQNQKPVEPVLAPQNVLSGIVWKSLYRTFARGQGIWTCELVFEFAFDELKRVTRLWREFLRRFGGYRHVARNQPCRRERNARRHNIPAVGQSIRDPVGLP